MKNPKDKELTGLLERQLREAFQRDNAEVKAQRARNHKYYSGEPFGDEKKGQSKHVSMDVFDAVESKKAYYLESLSASRKPCRFMPEGENQAQLAQMRTAYVQDVFYQDAGGWGLVRDSLHDAFVAKRCVARVEFRPSSEVMVERFDGRRMEELAMLQEQRPDAEINVSQSYDDGTMAGEVRYQEDTSGFEIELVQPELFFRDGSVDTIERAQFATEVWNMTRGQAIERGWPADAVSEMQFDREMMNTEEDFARQRNFSSEGNMIGRTDEQELVTAYLTHTYLNAENLARMVGEDGARDYMRDAQPGDYRLFRIEWSRGVILAVEEAPDGMPYLEWTEYKISHAAHGLCEADTAAPIQRTKSLLQRMVVENQARANSSRLIVREKSITNPRELLENNIGGVLFSKIPDAVMPLPSPQLSPATFGVLEMLDTEKENRSGLSRLSKGLNQDALSHQNADRMIERLTNSSNRRVMKGVRDYAENFLKPLFLRILELGVKHDKRPRAVEVAGKWQQISAQQLGFSARAEVAVALTPDECAKQAQTLMMVHQLLAADPVAGQLYGPAQRHALVDDIMDLLGQPDSSRYLMRPDSPEYQQQQQMQAQQMQAMQAMQQQMAQMQMMLMQSDDKRKWMETQVKALVEQAGMAVKGESQDLDERRFEHEKTRDMQELEIERSQKRGVSVG